jgi:hypothetical protein
MAIATLFRLAKLREKLLAASKTNGLAFRLGSHSGDHAASWTNS